MAFELFSVLFCAFSMPKTDDFFYSCSVIDICLLIDR